MIMSITQEELHDKILEINANEYISFNSIKEIISNIDKTISDFNKGEISKGKFINRLKSISLEGTINDISYEIGRRDEINNMFKNISKINIVKEKTGGTL